MAGRQLRDRESIALDLIGVVGLSAFLLGLVTLQASKELGFDAAAALRGMLGQLAVTLPAAALVLAATALELGTGLVVARAARRRPFDSIAETLLISMVAAVLKDAFLLGSLGAAGLFRAPILIGIDVAIIGISLWLQPTARHVHPLTSFPSWRDAIASIGSWPVAALVAIVWAGPVVLQLASPVVPFIDVLPNYVGPVEHLRTFGWFSPLTETQSPIIGPSRTVLGYDGLLGALATMTNLPGGLAIAGFVLPQTILVAAGAHRLATALRGGDVPIGPWALLAFALTQSFARLADARGTVVVVPLICIGLALAAAALAERGERDRPGGGNQPGRGVQAGDPWRVGRGAVVGLALGAATLVHPVIGFFAIVTVAIAALIRPRELAPAAFVAGLTAGLIAVPQLATMVGASLPTIALGLGLPIAVVIGLAAGRFVERSPGTRALLIRIAAAGRLVAIPATAGATLIAFAVGALDPGRAQDAIGATVDLALASSGVLLVVIVVGVLLGRRGARSPIVLAGLLVGIVAVFVAQSLPGNIGFLGDALRFEVPKTVHYWLATVAAVGAAAALAHAWTTDRLPFLARAGLATAFVAVAAYPLRPEPIDAYHLGEHRWSETFAFDLKYAASGFWVGFPNSRTIVDPPRQELLDAVRQEIDAGRLEHGTPVLHIARSFQQWVATPLGVFDGVDETFVSLDPEVSHQTVGGRLYGFDDLAKFLADPAFRYVVLEPDGVPDGTRDQLIAAGYASIFANGQGEVFRHNG